MAYSLNRAQLIGNLTRDPELRQTAGGQTVASFSLATNRTWVDRDGQKQDQADFHNIVVWGKLAEIAGQYLSKGRKVFIEGRMQTREWTGEDGVKRYRTEVVAENLILLDRPGDGASSGGNYERSSNSRSVKAQEDHHSDQASAPESEEEMALDDLPF